MLWSPPILRRYLVLVAWALVAATLLSATVIIDHATRPDPVRAIPRAYGVSK